MGVLRIMDRTGDRNVIRWGRSEREIARARRAFDDYRANGFDLFRLTEDENQGERMTEFDPDAIGILAVPRMVGG